MVFAPGTRPTQAGGAGQPLPADVSRLLAASASRLGPLGSRVLYFESIGSTNDEALGQAGQPGAEGTVVVAAQQTAGRGRRGRQWFSPPASGLYVSVLLNPGRARHEPARATQLVPLAAGVALAEAIADCCGLTIDLKWPNDLYVGRRKLGGILAEATGSSGPVQVVLGFGLNVAPSAYPPDVADRATSLEAALGRPVDRAMVFVESLAALARRYEDLLAGRHDAILDAWRERAPASVGTRVTWATPSGRQSGVTAGIDGTGALLVTLQGRVERIVGGEVEWSAGRE